MTKLIKGCGQRYIRSRKNIYFSWLAFPAFCWLKIIRHNVGSKVIKGNETIRASIKISNIGQREGSHSVELYTRDVYASITPSLRRLKAFKKIDLKPGETKEVQFILRKSDLSFINDKLKRVTEAGEFLIMIGDKRASFNYVP